MEIKKQLNIPITITNYRLAKVKAAILGINIGEYVERLIEANCKDISKIKIREDENGKKTNL